MLDYRNWEYPPSAHHFRSENTKVLAQRKMIVFWVQDWSGNTVYRVLIKWHSICDPRSRCSAWRLLSIAETAQNGASQWALVVHYLGQKRFFWVCEGPSSLYITHIIITMDVRYYLNLQNQNNNSSCQKPVRMHHIPMPIEMYRKGDFILKCRIICNGQVRFTLSWIKEDSEQAWR